MPSLEEKNTLIKYILYLIDLVSDLLEKHDFNFADYNQLVKEHEYFIDQVKNTYKLPNDFKEEISQLNLSYIYSENKNAFLRFLAPYFRRRFGTTHFTQYDKYDLFEAKENMIKYKVRLKNILLDLDRFFPYL